MSQKIRKPMCVKIFPVIINFFIEDDFEYIICGSVVLQ